MHRKFRNHELHFRFFWFCCCCVFTFEFQYLILVPLDSLWKIGQFRFLRFLISWKIERVMIFWSFDGKTCFKNQFQTWFFAFLCPNHWVLGWDNSIILFLGFFYAICIFGLLKKVEKWMSYDCWKFWQQIETIFFTTSTIHLNHQNLSFLDDFCTLIT